MLHRRLSPRNICHAASRYSPALALANSFFPGIEHHVQSIATSAGPRYDIDIAETPADLGAKNVPQEGIVRGQLWYRTVTLAERPLGPWKKHMRLVFDIRGKIHEHDRRTHGVLVGGQSTSEDVANAQALSSSERAKKRATGLDELPPEIRQVINYSPAVIVLQYQRHAQPENLPWRVTLSNVGAANKGARELLGEEIKQFMHYIEPTPLEALARDKAYRYVASLVDHHNALNGGSDSPVRTEVFGSSRNGLAYCLSDLDVRVFVESPAGRSRELIKVFKKSLYPQAFEPGLERAALRHGKYPIVEAWHADSGLNIQLVCNNSTRDSNEVLAQYLAELPLLKPLYYILRQALHLRGLDEAIHGGIGSYTLTMMIVAVLRRSPDGHEEATSVRLADHLLQFLSFYAEFPMRTTGLAIDPPTTFPKIPPGTDSEHHRVPHMSEAEPESTLGAREKVAQTDPLMPYLLCLQDPANPSNDLGSRAFAIKHVCATFRHLLDHVQQRMVKTDRASADQKNGMNRSLLIPFVGYCHKHFAFRRAKLEAYARASGASAVDGKPRHMVQSREASSEQSISPVEGHEFQRDVHQVQSVADMSSKIKKYNYTVRTNARQQARIFHGLVR